MCSLASSGHSWVFSPKEPSFISGYECFVVQTEQFTLFSPLDNDYRLTGRNTPMKVTSTGLSSIRPFIFTPPKFIECAWQFYSWQWNERRRQPVPWSNTSNSWSDVGKCLSSHDSVQQKLVLPCLDVYDNDQQGNY